LNKLLIFSSCMGNSWFLPPVPLQEAIPERNVDPSVRSHVLRAHAFRSRVRVVMVHRKGYPYFIPSFIRPRGSHRGPRDHRGRGGGLSSASERRGGGPTIGVGEEGGGGLPPPLFANIRAVTTSRNHIALAPRAALSGATEVGRSTVTVGCTAEAYANRLDFARMAFLFVVKNGACEPRFPRWPTSARATMRVIFLAIPRTPWTRLTCDN